MVTADGFIISHGMEVVETFEDAQVSDFIGEYKPAYSVLDIDHPKTIGAIDFTDYYFEHKMQVIQAMKEAGRYIACVAEDFEKRFERKYSFFEEYKLADAEVAIVALGSVCGTTKVVVDELRKEGIKAGLLKLRVFRPFPSHLLAQAISGCSAVAVLDRADGLSGAGGPLFAEVKSALYDTLHRKTIAPITPGTFDETEMIASLPIVKNYVYGLGGRDMRKEHLHEIFSELQEAMKGDRGESVRYIGVRG
jgi:pyruvate ferredoxin oxidoreductase alpha subunit